MVALPWPFAYTVKRGGGSGGGECGMRIEMHVKT